MGVELAFVDSTENSLLPSLADWQFDAFPVPRLPLFVYLVLPSFTGFYWVFPSFTGFSEMLPSFIGFHWVLPSFTGVDWV